jgi:large subunit ribosomal protein L31
MLYWNLSFPRKGLCSEMKAGIHPAYEEINVTCACGHSFRTRSTHKGDIRVEICSHCHPFYTGRQRLVDTEGRVERFKKKYANVPPRTTKTPAAQPTTQA